MPQIKSQYFHVTISMSDRQLPELREILSYLDIWAEEYLIVPEKGKKGKEYNHYHMVIKMKSKMLGTILKIDILNKLSIDNDVENNNQHALVSKTLTTESYNYVCQYVLKELVHITANLIEKVGIKYKGHTLDQIILLHKQRMEFESKFPKKADKTIDDCAHLMIQYIFQNNIPTSHIKQKFLREIYRKECVLQISYSTSQKKTWFSLLEYIRYYVSAFREEELSEKELMCEDYIPQSTILEDIIAVGASDNSE